MGRNGLIPLGLLLAFRDLRTGDIIVDDTGHDDEGADVGVGYDYEIDGDEFDEIGDDDEIGAMSKEERRYLREHKGDMGRNQRRDYRKRERKDTDDRAPRGRGGRDRDDEPKKEKKRLRTIPIGSSVAAPVGAWVIQIVPPVSGTIKDLVMTFPAGTTVTNISTGIDNAISGQVIAADMFSNTSYSRDTVAGLRIRAGVPLSISGAATAAGTVNASFVVEIAVAANCD